jgi:hypothetical protein
MITIYISYISTYAYIFLYFYNYIYIYVAVSNGKWKTEAQAIFLNPFTVCSSCIGKLSFVRLFAKKQTEVIRLQTD